MPNSEMGHSNSKSSFTLPKPKPKDRWDGPAAVFPMTGELQMAGSSGPGVPVTLRVKGPTSPRAYVDTRTEYVSPGMVRTEHCS